MTVVGNVMDDENELPEGWARAELGELGEWNSGGTPSKANLKYWDGSIPWVSPKDLKTDFIHGSIDHVSKAGISAARLKLLPAGTLMFVVRGMILARLFPVSVAMQTVTVNQDIRSITPYEGVEPGFLLRALQLAGMRILFAVRESTHGTKRLDSDELKKWPIALPPLAEQHRIVEKLEALFARVEAARERLTRASAFLKRFRQSVLAAACSGELTKDWREAQEEPAAEVSRTQLLAVRRKLTNQQVNFPADGEVYGAPRSWAVFTTDELTTVVTSGSRAWSRFYDRGNATFVMAQNVRPLRLDLTHRQAVDPPVDDPERHRTLVEKDDILVTIVGANTGDVCRVDRPVSEHFVCQSVALMRPADQRIAKFMELWLNSAEHGRRQYLDYIYGEGRPHLSLDQLRQTSIAVPGWNEQREIAQRVDALLTLADTIEKRISAALARSENFPQAILAKALDGELVSTEAEVAREEGRDFEHASALIERMRANRAGKAPSRTKGLGGRRRG